MQVSLTQGSVGKHYWKYLGAAFGSAMLGCIYGMVDAAAVGQYHGPQGTAVLSIVMPIWTILYSLGFLIGTGGSVNYAFFKAQGKTEKANAYFSVSLILTSMVAVLCWVGIAVFEDPLLRLFGADDTLLILAKEYLKPIIWVIPAYPFTQLLSAFLRNDNAPGLATIATVIGGVFNVFGDIFFTFDFGLGLGIFGAGLATALGVSITIAIMSLHFITRRNSLKLTRIFRSFHKSARVAASGFPSFVADLAMGIVAILFNRQIMFYFGADALAVFGVIVQVTAVVQCSSYGLGQAAQPLLSANFAAGLESRIGEIKKLALWTASFFGVFWYATVLAFPNAYVHLFMTPTDAVLQIAPQIMRIYSFSFLLLPLNIFATYYFQSVMKPKIALIISMARGIVLCSVLVFVLPALFGKDALWWVMPITEALVAGYVILSISNTASCFHRHEIV